MNRPPASQSYLTGYSRDELIRIYKAMNCLSYQCSEGNVPESPLFKQLEAAIGAVACRVVDLLPEYEKAAWA